MNQDKNAEILHYEILETQPLKRILAAFSHEMLRLKNHLIYKYVNINLAERGGRFS